MVRAAPNLLAVNDPLLLPQIYHRRADKTDVYTTGVLGEQTIKRDDHAAKRKRVANTVGAITLHPTTDARFLISWAISLTKNVQFTITNLRPLEGRSLLGSSKWTSVLNEKLARTGEKMDFTQWYQYA